MGDPTKCVYKFIYDKREISNLKIIQYSIMHGLGLCIKVDSYVAHMFYACSFIHNTAVPIYIKNNKYFLYFNTNTTVFSWGDGNYNKNWTYQLDKLIWHN